ncbi:GTPase domain-containing protein [uncultured Shewanella sp.]|uniref:GTPase family protein n=1 Tax=uncultured Shewanella sp. TaxID=173975 RepID=UPI0026359478|nr:GTPase domain-containing protein [uncultured Shewanella sp.]
MTNLHCSVKIERDVPALVQRRNSFAFLHNRQPVLSLASSWRRGDNQSHDIQVIAIGKSGYGKSTTLNQLVGEDVFDTNDIEGCTRVMQSAEYRFQTHEALCHFSLADLPGIGETPNLDHEYINLYREAIKKAHSVIYFLRADQRDYTIDQWAFSQLFKTPDEKRKVILALNAVDKIEPLNRRVPFELSREQTHSLQLKLQRISTLFALSEDQLVTLSATEQFNMDSLVDKLAKHLQPYLKEG